MKTTAPPINHERTASKRFLKIPLRSWRITLVTGGLYALITIPFQYLKQPDRPLLLLAAAAGAVVFGAIMAASFAWFEQRALRRIRASDGVEVGDDDILNSHQLRTFRLPRNASVVFEDANAAMIEFGAIVDKIDSTAGVLEGQTAQSWKSYGELISVRIVALDLDACEVTLASRPRMWVTNYVTNYGRSWDNVEALQKRLATGSWPQANQLAASGNASKERPSIHECHDAPPAIFTAGAWQRVALTSGCYALLLPGLVKPEKFWIIIVAAVVGVGIELVAYRRFAGNVRQAIRSAEQENWEAILINVWTALFLGATLVNPAKPIFELENIAAALMIACFSALAVKRIVDKNAERGQRARLAQDRERAEFDRQLAEAKLVALSAQIEPHFLFNSLASIQYLIRHDAEKAHAMVSDLIRYLRLALPKMKQAVAPLEDELDLVRAYLGVMQIRMGERLRFDVAPAGNIGRIAIPTMTLITLVENAIKHGLERKPEGGSITVRATLVDDTLQLVVADTGGGFQTESSGTGIGLTNIRERLSNLYGARGHLNLEANQPSGVRAVVTIPSGNPV